VSRRPRHFNVRPPLPATSWMRLAWRSAPSTDLRARATAAAARFASAPRSFPRTARRARIALTISSDTPARNGRRGRPPRFPVATTLSSWIFISPPPRRRKCTRHSSPSGVRIPAVEESSWRGRSPRPCRETTRRWNIPAAKGGLGSRRWHPSTRRRGRQRPHPRTRPSQPRAGARRRGRRGAVRRGHRHRRRPPTRCTRSCRAPVAPIENRTGSPGRRKPDPSPAAHRHPTPDQTPSLARLRSVARRGFDRARSYLGTGGAIVGESFPILKQLRSLTIC
jgi:hypothetical protein